METQLNIQYGKKIETLTQQLKSEKELNQKNVVDTHKNHADQLAVLNQKLKSQEELYQKTLQETGKLQNEKLSVLNTKITDLTNQQSQKDALLKQASELANNYKRKAEQAESGVSYTALIVTIIISLVIGLLLANGCK